MITIKEIAKICNVSTSTVSNILNGKSKASEQTTKHVLEVIAQTGYKPNSIAQGLLNQKTKTIAIIAEDIAQFTSPHIIESIMSYTEQYGYKVNMRNLRMYGRWSDTWYGKTSDYFSIVKPILKDVLASQADGIIYIAGHTRIIECFDDNFPIPAVMSYAYSENTLVPSVVIDDVKSAYEMVKYLISKGHKKIGFIGGRMDNIHTQQRLLGYQNALLESGILFNPNLVYYAEWSREKAFEGVKHLLDNANGDISAFFCISDRMAGGVYDYLEKINKKVGTDISVAGFDDEIISSYFSPQLTTMALPLRQIGELSAKLLVDMIEGRKSDGIPEKNERGAYEIPSSLVIRKSVNSIDF